MNQAQKIAEIIAAINHDYLRALSIRQPWCHHILHDGKDVENRSWPTKGRGWFLIHAGKAWDGSIPDSQKHFHRGGIVGAARIVDCVQSMDSKWFFGPNGFVLEDAFEIPFIPCKGALSFFKPDCLQEVKAILEKQS